MKIKTFHLVFISLFYSTERTRCVCSQSCAKTASVSFYTDQQGIEIFLNNAVCYHLWFCLTGRRLMCLREPDRGNLLQCAKTIPILGIFRNSMNSNTKVRTKTSLRMVSLFELFFKLICNRCQF